MSLDTAADQCCLPVVDSTTNAFIATCLTDFVIPVRVISFSDTRDILPTNHRDGRYSISPGFKFTCKGVVSFERGVLCSAGLSGSQIAKGTASASASGSMIKPFC